MVHRFPRDFPDMQSTQTETHGIIFYSSTGDANDSNLNGTSRGNGKRGSNWGHYYYKAKPYRWEIGDVY